MKSARMKLITETCSPGDQDATLTVQVMACTS